MRAFIPSDPYNKNKTQAEAANWRHDLDSQKKKEKLETRRFVITTIIGTVAAVAAVVAAVASIINCLS